MKLLAALHKGRPLEVYVISAILYGLLFLNPAEFYNGFDIGDLFKTRTSIIRGLIGGVGDDDLRLDQASLLYWILSVVYVAVVIVKSSQISNWLWNDDYIRPKSYSE